MTATSRPGWLRAAMTRPDRPAPLVVALIAIIVLAQGASLYIRLQDEWERFLQVALVLLGVSLLLPRALDRRRSPAGWETLLAVVLGAGIVAGALELLLTATPSLEAWRATVAGFTVTRDLVRVVLAIGVVVALAGLRARAPLGRWHVPVLLAILAFLGWWIIAGMPAPHIDVFTFERDAARALLAGRDPFAIENLNIYPDTLTYPPGWVTGDVIHVGYTYPPLTLLLYAPAEALLGDVRYGNLAALLGAAALIGWIRPGRLSRGAVGLLLFTPILGHLIVGAFTEPVTLLCLALTVAAAVRAPRWTGAALGLLLVSKQYAVLFLPLVALLIPVTMTRRQVGRQALAALATALLTTLPFVLWDPAAAWRSLVEWFLALPERPGSFGFWNRFVEKLGPAALSWMPPLAAGVAWVVGLVRLAWTPSGFAMGAAIVIGAFFAASKQAFPNYHVLVIGGVCLAVAVAALGDGERGPQDGTSGPVSSPPPVR